MQACMYLLDAESGGEACLRFLSESCPLNLCRNGASAACPASCLPGISIFIHWDTVLWRANKNRAVLKTDTALQK